MDPRELLAFLRERLGGERKGKRAKTIRKIAAMAIEGKLQLDEWAEAREFDRISEKIRRSLPFKTWREMDRFVKGDRFGLRR